MATPDEIRRRLEEQAGQRVNPLLKGLSMLTGGIAGEFTGTNEQIRQQRQAKRALMAEEAAALEDQRILERARITREEELKRRIAEKAAEDEARLLEETRKSRGAEMALKREDMVGPLDPATMAGMAAAKAAQARVQAERMNALKGRETEMRGYLAGRGVQLGEPDVETVAFLEAQERSKEALKKEQDTKMQLITPSGSVVYGSYDELSKKYPDLIANISVAKPKESKPLDVSFREADGEYVFNFGPGVSPEAAAKYKQDVYKAFGTPKKDDLSGAGGEGTKAFPKAPPRGEGEPMVGRSDGKPRSAADAVVSEMAATPVANMYGPLSPSEQFTKTGRQLKALEGRGGAYTYGASQTLTDPFYESVASELGTKPQRIGQESVLVRGAKSVIANEFPTEQWNSLPQEVKNRIYIEALNKSAAEISKPQTSRGYNRSPFADISYQRD
jgi:hypothetical protein